MDEPRIRRPTISGVKVQAPAPVAPSPPGSVLVVDGDPALLESFSRYLGGARYEVTAVEDVEHAVASLEQASFDVVVSALELPGTNGLELLRRVRLRSPDLPVVLMTLFPSTTAAAQALDLGALRVLPKPMTLETLDSVVAHAVNLRRVAQLKRQAALHLEGAAPPNREPSGIEERFAWALDALTIVYQPIVRWSLQAVYGHEALLRTSDPLLSHGGALVEAAASLGRLHELGQRARAHIAGDLAAGPADTFVFVNLHARDLEDDTLMRGDSAFALFAKRCVLEVTDRAALEAVPNARARVDRLRQIGFRLAIDDLGTGHGGLAIIAQLRPDIVKLDISLVRDVDRDPIRRSLVGAMLDACYRSSMEVIAEGVETDGERDALAELGCDLMQGFLFARPGPLGAEPRF